MTGPAKILHVIRSAGMGGVEQQARDLSTEMLRRGRGLGLAVLTTEPLLPHVRAWHERCVPLTLFDDRRGRILGLDRLVRLRRFFDFRKADIVHLHYALPDSLIWNDIWAAAGNGRRVVASLHHAVRWSNASSVSQMKQRLARWPIERFFATTPAGSELLALRLPVEKIRTVPCGVTNADTPASFDRAAARRFWGLSDEDKVLGCVCRIEPEKGVFELASAVAELARKHPQLRLLIAGDGPARLKLQNDFLDIPNVRCIGRVEHTDNFYAAIDVFAMPSVEEGFGVVYIEAARFGLPSIACKLPTVSHVVENGLTGWLVEPGDYQQLARTIDHICVNWDEVKQKGSSASARAARFDMKVVADQFEAIYEELVCV